MSIWFWCGYVQCVSYIGIGNVKCALFVLVRKQVMVYLDESVWKEWVGFQFLVLVLMKFTMGLSFVSLYDITSVLC